MARIRRMLDLSTAHLPPRYAEPGPGADDGVIADRHGEYGWWMWVPEDPDEHAAQYRPTQDYAESIEHLIEDGDWPSEELLAVQRYARSLDCDWVLFDRDGEPAASLPTWDWEAR